MLFSTMVVQTTPEGAPERYDEEYDLFLRDLRTIAKRVAELEQGS